MKSEDLNLHSLKAISPIDGRHRLMTAPLSDWFSEYALFKYKVHVEIEYLIALSEHAEFQQVREFTTDETRTLREIAEGFTLKDAQVIQNIDRFGHDGKKAINHDVKAVEYFVKSKLTGTLKDVIEMVHFGLTSEDINNLALCFMLRGALDNHYVPAMVDMLDNLSTLASAEKNTVMLSKTHGQPATPTTFGKEMANHLDRMRTELIALTSQKIMGKLNGAVGNYNAHIFAAPEVDWIAFSDSFIRSLGFEPNLMTTQIESHDGLTRIFSSMISLNNMMKDISVDLWMYISAGYLTQKKLTHEVGSSTMPHKINPWRIEVAEGSAEESTSKLIGFIRKLQSSRLQRDLSDHEAIRAIGVSIAHSYIASLHVSEELGRLSVARDKMVADLNMGSILTEAVQTLLRKEGYARPYELMKDISRGRHFSVSDLKDHIKGMEIKKDTRARLLSLSPENYIGAAPHLTELAVEKWRLFKEGREEKFDGRIDDPTQDTKQTRIHNVIIDCRQLTEDMRGDAIVISNELSKRGITPKLLNAEDIDALTESHTDLEHAFKDTANAMFVGYMDGAFMKAEEEGMLCVNIEGISGKKSEYNIFRLSELTAIIDSLDDK